MRWPLSSALLLTAFELCASSSLSCFCERDQSDDRHVGGKTMLQVRKRQLESSAQPAELTGTENAKNTSILEAKSANALEHLNRATQLNVPKTWQADLGNLTVGTNQGSVRHAFHALLLKEFGENGLLITIAAVMIAMICAFGICTGYRSEDESWRKQLGEKSNDSIPKSGNAPRGIVSGSMEGGLALCHNLVVPCQQRLSCVIQTVLHGKQQDVTFEINNKRGDCIFQVVVCEGQPDFRIPGIFLKCANGVRTHGFLSTANLWIKDGHKELFIHQGAYTDTKNLFGVGEWMYYMQKNRFGAYDVFVAKDRHENPDAVLTFYGDFEHMFIGVRNAAGRTVGEAKPINDGCYCVQVHENVDASLVILAMLGISKAEGKGTFPRPDPWPSPDPRLSLKEQWNFI